VLFSDWLANNLNFFHIFKIESEKPSLGIDSATFLIEKSISDKNYKEIRVNQEAYEINMGNNVGTVN
jgi:hypothetical protein